ncbi:vacuolar membrane-associated protein iml1, partial [Coemansia thaxteri]
MPQANPGASNRGHVSIFDRRGQKPGRGRVQGGGASNTNTSFAQSSSHRGTGSGNQSAHGDDTGHGAAALFNKVCMLRIHEDTFSSSDLVLNPSFFPGIRVGDIVAIRPIPDGDDGGGDLASPKGLLDAESGAGGAHSSDASSAAKGKGPAAPQTSSSGTLAHSSQTADSGEAGASSTSVPPGRGADRDGRSGPRDLQRGSTIDASRVSSARRAGHPFASLMPRALNRLQDLGEGADEFARNMERADDDHNESILKPDPHREILLKVGEVRRDSQQLQASIVNHVARALWGEYLTNQRVAIRKINMSDSNECESIRADFVEIAFRDQYVGRSDMWRLWRNLSQKIVHNNKPTNMEGLIRASVRRIYKNGQQIPCGYIDDLSQPIFRSESGRFMIFIQMSEEMWSYQEDGNLCFEKAVNCFMAELFRRWNEKQLNHMVTIVMFSRWYYHARDYLYFQDLILDEDSGRYYRDYYKVIADMEVRPDWSMFLPEILSEFNSFRRDIQEIVTADGHRLRGDLSRANQGNILEAINLGINSFASHHVDRDLSRTGLSTIVITPSFGVFDVTKRLLRMTTERMLHFGMRVDFVCLAPKPLFRPPVFRFKAMPVPSEQNQQRALLLRQQARQTVARAKESELNSVSPLGEGPEGYASPLATMPMSALPKDRIAKGIAPAQSESPATVDPIMLDPLYFNESKWENELLPFLIGPKPQHGASANTLSSVLFKAQGSRNSRASVRQPDIMLATMVVPAVSAATASLVAPGTGNADSSSKQDHETSIDGSIASALLGNIENIAEVPSTILKLRTADYPFFSQQRATPGNDRQVVYCYFPYWVDCGFYNYSDDPVPESTDDFKPVCKMGDIPVAGVASYMRKTPLVPDLNLSAVDQELSEALGLDSESTPGVDSITEDRTKLRDEDTRSINAQFFSTTRDIVHGRIVQLDRAPAVAQSRERLLEVFAKYDRQAIVGTGISSATSAAMAAGGELLNGVADGIGVAPSSALQTYTGGTSEHRLPLGSVHPAPLQGVLPSNASAHWEDHHHQQQQQGTRYSENRAAIDRVEVGSAGSAEALEHLLGTVSTSASPNLCHGQHIKPLRRTEQDGTSSSSVPREAKLGGSSATGAQRSSIFVRNNSQRKRAPQPAVTQTTPDPNESVEYSGHTAVPQPSQRHAAPGHGASPEHSNYVAISGTRGRPLVADNAVRPALQRVAESPQSIARGQYIQHNYSRLSGEMLAVTSGDRLPVAESMAKQSHMEDNIRTFRGADTQEAVYRQQHQLLQQQQQPIPTVTMPTAVAAYRHPMLTSALLSEPEFNLTLPSGLQAVLPLSATVPSQPLAPTDYHSGSPQYGKCSLLSNRPLLSLLPDPSPRGQRGRHYSSYNPCNPNLHMSVCTELSQRWAFALPTYSSLSSITPKWRSLCTPASLPLVTDYYPTDLDVFYRQYSYHMPTSDSGGFDDAMGLLDDDCSEFSQFMTNSTMASLPSGSGQVGLLQQIDRTTRRMLREMIYQRLAQGFQFINISEAISTRNSRDRPVGASKRGPLFKHNGRSEGGDRMAARSGTGDLSIASGSPHLSILPSGTSQALDKSVWLSNGRQIQKLDFHSSSGSSHMPGVTATWWDRNKSFDQADLHYRFHMWSRNNNMGYRLSDIRFSYPLVDEVNWNSVDRLIVGHQTNPTKTTKYWSARYILVPVDQLGNDTIVNTKSNPNMTIEDVRIANFERFLDHIIRLLRWDERAKLEERFFGALPVEMRQGIRPAMGFVGGANIGPVGSEYGGKKALGLGDLIPSALMQIRYTTLNPVPYLSYQLYCYVNDKIYSDPKQPMSLPPPAATFMNLTSPLNVESPFSQLAYALQHPTIGLKLRNLRWHYAYYSSIFVGYQLVDWMLVNFDGVYKRNYATGCGNRLMERGLFCSAQHNPGPFMDGYHFYVFTDLAREYTHKFMSGSAHQPARGQGTLMSSIGLADMVNRYGASSNNPSPSVSRPVSRQGSNAPSVLNNDGDTAVPTAITPVASTGAKKGTPLVAASAAGGGGGGGAASTMVGVGTWSTAATGIRDSTSEATVSDTCSSGAQPASKLRVRTDLSGPSSKQSTETQSAHTEAGQRGSGADSAETAAGPRPMPTEQQPQASISACVSAGGWGSESQSGQAANDRRRTPDVYPELSRRWARRPLPKLLDQSRMFKLDLDQQRKSTRVENCMVHLDAVQNPMTCFHLSINWLNCTNHLVDEM